jgi:MSHA pilin protein MshD
MRRQRGFTLIEAVLAIVIMAVGLSAVVALFVQTAGSSHEPLLRERALTVAKAYLDEIMSRRWDENTPVGGGCVSTAAGQCTAYCAGLGDAQCVASKCELPAAGDCQPAAAVSGVVPGAEETARVDYDDIDDYDGLDDSPPTDDRGHTLPNYGAEYRVRVTVEQPGDWNGIAAADVRRITVQVDYPEGSLELVGYRVNF